ncbi:hypothetical protein XM38_019140 [Halomicronema hongdechloris C2206]|uniref:Uncharacterized protein n=1 Tax=Halomicronema hongdechloris C2206 TaxID=1641165 RepID=A0A1Z3HKZ1_9CYAN|nr:hypothetical protein XM38_019140 [Halomicronema hongdechloris C2206]
MQLQLVECPLTGDASVIAEHVNFVVELPEPVSFNFLGCFEMEIRGIGFVPQFEKFDNEAAMRISGQVKFAQGGGDALSARIDVHDLYIGLPRPGSFVPRLYFRELVVEITSGEAFKLYGVVEMIDEADAQGFAGEGRIEIKGLPVIAASFAFLRVRRDETAPWVRAWFVFLQIEQVTFRIPYVELYIREVGLGFGYRYTLASIRAADEAGDLQELLSQLRSLSRTQGDLTRRDRWAVDIEGEGEALRWTIVLRALISQTSASPNSLRWIEQAERVLPCLYVFDAIIAFRSDLTFFMAVRCWFNTNYWGFVNDVDGLRERPLLTGFVLLSVRQKRFLAQIASNPEGSLGHIVPIPPLVERIVNNAQFSATLLIEPGLVMRNWAGPICCAGLTRLVPGCGDPRRRHLPHHSRLSGDWGRFLARASFRFQAERNLRVFGARVTADVNGAFGARYIGLMDFNDPVADSAFYAAIGIEVRIRIAIEFWIKFLFIEKSFEFSVSLEFTAAMEVGVASLNPSDAGFRARGTLAVRFMGRGIQLSVSLGFREEKVTIAQRRVEPFLGVGLEATDVEAVPGVEPADAGGNGQTVLATATSGGPPPTPAAAFLATGPRATTGTPPTAPSVLGSSVGASAGRAPQALTATGVDVTAVLAALEGITLPAPSPQRPPYHPNYDVFLIDDPDDGSDYHYFVLVPRGKLRRQHCPRRIGFLPAPPMDDQGNFVQVEQDFELTIPAADLTLEQYDPIAADWVTRPLGQPFSWQVAWTAPILTGIEFDPATETPRTDGSGVPIPGEQQLQDYLTYAFKVDGEIDQERIIADPDPLCQDRHQASSIADERVHNPSEDAFEAAVRGALEQFRGSPYFKRDPNSPYDHALDGAFQATTTIYNDSGAIDEAADINQQAHQLRGLVVHDLVNDLRSYAEAALETKPDVTAMIGFQMGLVFRCTGSLPTWLTEAVTEPDKTNTDFDPATASIPILYQRLGPHSPRPDKSQYGCVRTFNIAAANFALNPPQFQRIEQYTDANTIALAWDLTWAQPPALNCSECQAEPEHHLIHYQVRRRSLDGGEREVSYTVKGAEALHYETRFQITAETLQTLTQALDAQAQPSLLAELQQILTPLMDRSFQGQRAFLAALEPVLTELQQQGASSAQVAQLQALLLQAAIEPGSGLLQRLQPRFQLVDHFNAETLEDQAALPVTGRSYLYSITPVDLAGHSGRPLTLVATRYPNEPPRVPVNGRLIMRYDLQQQGDTVVVRYPNRQDPLLSDIHPERPTLPTVLLPTLEPDGEEVELGIEVTWQDPQPQREGPRVPIATYRLIFRRETILPIGSYGLDNSIQGPRTKTLPTSNARPLPTDIKIDVIPSGPQEARRARIPLETLQQTGIFPAGEAALWQPQAWRIYLQTISANQVPSALAPVELVLRFDSPDGREEKQPSELEWVPKPIRLPVLPPEDQRATTGPAHFPMPRPDRLKFQGTPAQVAAAVHYGSHPAGLRLIRFRWNQGPSGQADYPTDLNGGYELLQLDADAHTDTVWAGQAGQTERFARAWQPIQDVQMLPGVGSATHPRRHPVYGAMEACTAVKSSSPLEPGERGEGSQIPRGPWYSWRESILVWPQWQRPQAIDRASDAEAAALHPLLRKILDDLGRNYTLDLQTNVPMQPVEFAPFMDATAFKADPYGWGILQRLGLSITVSLRQRRSNDLLTGQELLQVLLPVVDVNQQDPAYQGHYSHLHVELLVQPSRRVSPGPLEGLAPDALLGMVQLSMRPTIRQVQRYGQVTITGTGSTSVQVAFTLNGPCTVINQADAAGGQLELEPSGDDDKPIVRSLRLPLTGKLTLLLRGRQLPTVALEPVSNLPQGAREPSISPVEPFAATDERSTYFTVAVETLANAFSDSTPVSAAQTQWRRLKAYLEFLNPDDDASANPRLRLPTDADGIAAVLPDFLAWSQRFFDANGATVIDAGGLAVTDSGPWLVTAYPHSGSPAYASPDRSGRLSYDHVLETRWAHAYRYYIRPYNRYELLWQSLLQSPTLFQPAASPTPVVTAALLPDPAAAGLDVVLERTQPIDKPLVLSSGRLDAPSQPGQPAPPGAIWEVMVAQHREQRLAERNQTVARRLAYRQIAFTLLRRFAYEDWRQDLGELVANDITLSYVENQEQTLRALPAAYPDRPDHLDLSQRLSETVGRSLDLPPRLGNFQQGALVLQWQGLPYFYEHRLLLIAQSASTVSLPNEIHQRDFEYRSPDPQARVDAIAQAWTPVAPFHQNGTEAVELLTRRLQLQLQRFWDCLPQTARHRWPDEQPSTDSVKPAALPDPEVVYQVVEIFSGNIEVQAEFFYDADAKIYRHRQLGKRFLAQVHAVELTPDIALDEEGVPQTAFTLRTTLQQVSQVTLGRRYDLSRLAASPTGRKLAFEGGDGTLLAVVSVFTRQDYQRLLLLFAQALFVTLPGYPQASNPADAAIASFLQQWFATRRVAQAQALDQLSVSLQAKLTYPELPYQAALSSGLDLPSLLQSQLELGRSQASGDTRLHLAWRGAMTQTQAVALGAYHSDLPEFQDAVDRLLNQLRSARFAQAYAVPARPRPDAPDLPEPFSIEVVYPPDADPGWMLRWNGPITTEQQQNVQHLSRNADQPFQAALTRLTSPTVESTQTIRADRSRWTPPSAPDRLAPLTVTNSFGNRHALRWTGPLSEDQENALRGLNVDAVFEGGGIFDPNRSQRERDFRLAINDLIQKARASFAAAETAPFAWPRVDQAQLVAAIHDDLAGLQLPAPDQDGPIRRQGANGFQRPLPELLARVRAVLRSGDPFIAALEALLDQIAGSRFQVAIALDQLFHCHESLTPTEKQALEMRFGEATLTDLFADLDDHQALERLYQDWFSQGAISAVPPQPLPATVGDRVDFPDAENCVLRRVAQLPSETRAELLALPGDEGFQAALRRLTRPTQAELPSNLQDNLQIAADSLSWRGAAPSQEQRQALSDLDGDQVFRQAIRRLLRQLNSGVPATVELGPAPEMAAAIAPQGLDQVPPSLQPKITVSGQTAAQQDRLQWRGPLFQSEEDTLRRWAQIPEFLAGVNDLGRQHNRQVVIASLPQEIPLWVGRSAPDCPRPSGLARGSALGSATASLRTSAG